MIEVIFVDVDGTMTDGGIYYDEFGNELKKFNTRDAAGFFAAIKIGIKVVVLTGRSSEATRRRIRDLGINELYENILDKKSFIVEYSKNNNIQYDKIAFIGDDLNDYNSMKLVGFSACPKDACVEIINISKYISSKKGGEGVIRDVVMYVLGEKWDSIINEVYQVGI